MSADINQTYQKNKHYLLEVAGTDGGGADYSEIAIRLAVSDDDALKLLRKAATENTALSHLDGYRWPVLIDIESPALPSLDLSLFPTWMGGFAKALSDSTETPPELAGAMVLSIAALAASRRITVEVKPGYTEPTCLWVAPGLEPANRKSTVVNSVLAPVQAWEKLTAESMQDDIRAALSARKTKEARIKSLRTAAASPKAKPIDIQRHTDEIVELERGLDEVPAEPRLWTSDATPETFGSMLAQQGECMALVSSEGAIIDILAGRYSSGTPNMDLFLKGHSGDPDVTDRLSRATVRLNHPRITIGISPQPEVFNAMASIKGGEGRGLLARFLYFLPASPLGYRTLDTQPIPEGIKSQYHAAIHAMLDWPLCDDSPTGCHTATLSQGATEKWREFQVEIERQIRPGGYLNSCKAWAGKAAGAAARVAGIMHGALHAHSKPWDTPIEAETMESALEVVAVAMEHSKAVLAQMGMNQSTSDAIAVLEWFRRKQVPMSTTRGIHADLKHRLKTAKQVRDAVELLQEHGYVLILNQESTGGRTPSPHVFIRPEVLEARS